MKGTRGLLIKGILERKSSDAFKHLGPEMKELLHGRPGIYALYKGDDLYYVGLGIHLHSRLKDHLWNDRLAGKWDSFSIFTIRKRRYLKDLETLILRIARPKGAKITGRVPHDHALEGEYRRFVKEHIRRTYY